MINISSIDMIITMIIIIIIIIITIILNIIIVIVIIILIIIIVNQESQRLGALPRVRGPPGPGEQHHRAPQSIIYETITFVFFTNKNNIQILSAEYPCQQHVNIFAHFQYSRSRVSPTVVLRSSALTSKFNEVGRLHLHISWPIRQPGGQPTLRDSGQNAPTSRRSNTLTRQLQ